jgi:23S rRNA pseudouridine1911/1915/1917 synthase
MKAARTASTNKTSTPKILLEDTHLIVLDKPAGLLSQGEKTGDVNLVDWLRAYLGRPYVGLIHRLDRNTSGIMVVAKRTKSAERLTRALQEGSLTREYLAWVEGSLGPPGKTLSWSHSLKKDERTNRTSVVKTGTPGAKVATLKATPLQSGVWKGSPLTLVRFRLETGRSHQIRAQAAHEGHALLGDRKYAAILEGFPRVALHSWKISFPHPMGGAVVSLEAPVPEDMRSLLSEEL